MEIKELIGSCRLDNLNGIETLVSPRTGKKLICIPVGADNPCITVGETKDGKKYFALNVVIKESPKQQFGNTHYIKAVVEKKNKDAFQLTPEQVKNLSPILGNLKTVASEVAAKQDNGQVAVHDSLDDEGPVPGNMKDPNWPPTEW